MHQAGSRRPVLGLLLAGCCLLLTWPGLAQEATPPGKTVLTISGRIGAVPPGVPVAFDLARLEALPQRSFTTQTPWQDKPLQFTGPLLREVLASVKAQGSQLKAIALNDYKVSIPVSDTQRFDMLLALRVNGERIPVRSKGPLFVVYPYDSDEELRSTLYYSRSIWQLKAIEVE
ncbi:molybdopterin-dependent oxidoreductase [Malikia granosa]|uniref:molybdopterin-dependent oxidoreductase n=1 Tax=Malikia granosa TaxID=263067 RepID=UPI0011B06748|nr:molybdopterin-dependent oxidoreductase [Malikia granosa]